METRTEARNISVTARSNASQRIIALGIVGAILYVAASVLIALLLAVLFAFFLDPVVKLLERIHVSRAFGALLVLLAALTALCAAGYFFEARLEVFAVDWPRYSLVLRQSAQAVDRKVSQLERRVSEITPKEDRTQPSVQVVDPQPVRTFLLSGIGSLYSIFLVAAVVPFLVFFMLAGKSSIWRATLDLFEDRNRMEVRAALQEMDAMLRSYVAGNALVAAVLILACWGFFTAMRLDYPFLTAVVSGIFSLVPYLGAVLAWLPPFLIGAIHWKNATPYLVVAGVLSVLHILAMNVLIPKIVGRRVHLNAIAVTIALLFWGWIWGAMGLLLAIPITATVKVVCDHVPAWRPAGRWLGA